GTRPELGRGAAALAGRLVAGRISAGPVVPGLAIAALAIPTVVGLVFGPGVARSTLVALHLLLELGAGHDVDLPSGQLAGQPDVLPLAADREREVLLGDQDQGLLGLLVELDVRDLGRLQRVGDQRLRVVVPADDVDALAVELVDDRLDARAADADARADAVD